MRIARGGKFSFTITSEQLSKGLRPSKRVPRDSGFLTKCSGAVGRDQVLQILDEYSRIDTSTISDGFPFPQIFMFTNLIIVCSATKIYEWVASSLVEKIEVASGGRWAAMAIYNSVYMSNGVVAVIKDPTSFAYSTTSDLPIFSSICNYNGQIMISAPEITL